VLENKSSKFKAAAVQAAPVFMDLEGCVKKAEGFIRSAAAQGCRLVAFSECWIPGYPWYIWLNNTALNMKYFVDYHENSLVAGGEAFQAIARLAKEYSIFVSMGASERDNGSLYISQFLFSPEGELISGRRKLKPTHMERTVYGEGDGSDLQVVDTTLGRIGQLSCWEHLQPLTKYAMFSQHEQIHLGAWPSFSTYPEAYALGAELNNRASQVYAAEGQCFVIAPCGMVSAEMIDLLVENELHASLLSQGGGYAQIYGPDGKPLCTPLDPSEEGLLIAELDLQDITMAKCFADPVGHYARPDVTRLLLNTDPQPRTDVLLTEPLPSRMEALSLDTADEPLAAEL